MLLSLLPLSFFFRHRDGTHVQLQQWGLPIQGLDYKNNLLMHRLRLLLWLLALCIRLASSQPAAVLSMTLSSYGIQDVATYSFKIAIQGDGSTTLVIPAGSQIVIKLPSQYPSTPTASKNCTTASWPVASGVLQCSLAYNIITISNAFASDYTIGQLANIQLLFAVQSITNPTYAQQINNPAISGVFRSNFTDLLAFAPTSYITIQSGILGVAISASPTTTDSSSILTVSITPAHSIPVGGCLKITLDKFYSNAVHSTALITQSPLCQAIANASGNLYCTYVPNTNNIVVTVTNIFTTPSSSPFSFTLSPFTNPPTTQSSGSFTFITSSQITNGLTLDTSTNNRISGITPSLIQNPTATFSTTLIGSLFEMTINTTITNAIIATDVITIITPPEISCAYVTAASIAGNPGGSLSIINSTTFQFSNIVLYNPYPIKIIISNLSLPPYAASISSPFIMLVTRNSFYLVCKMNTSFPISLSPGSLTGALTANSNQAGVSSDYIFSMSFQHAISSTSKLTFYFSSSFFSIGSNISCISSASSCTASSSNNLVTVTSLTIVTTTSLTISLLGITNPSTIGNFTPIIVTSFIQISGVFYLLDSSNTFAYFTVIARPMNFNDFNFTTSSDKVYDLATYTFSIQNNNYLPPNSYIWLLFPNEIGLSSITCDSICVPGIYNASNGIQFQQLGPLPPKTVSTFTVSNILNPISTKPTSNFALYIFDSQKNLLEYLSSGRTYAAKTPSLLTISISGATLQNSYVGWLNLSYSPIFQISEPVCLLLIVPNSLSCPSCLSSVFNSTYSQMVFTNQTMLSGKYTLNLPNFTYHYSLEPISISAAIMSSSLLYNYASGSFPLTNQISSNPLFTYSFTNYERQALTDLIISNLSSAAASQMVSSMKLTFGSDFNTAVLGCLNNGYTCAINGSTVTISTSSTANLTAITITNLITPSGATSTSVSLSTYSSSGYIIGQSTNIIWQAACTLPCKTCTSTVTSCLDCYTDQVLAQSRVLYFPLNSTCVSDCGDKFYRNLTTNICMACSTSCYNCYNATYCTSCPTGQYLLASNTTCFAACPTGHFQMGINCIACTPSLNCYTCVNELRCTSCLNSFFYQAQCLPDCPSPTFVPNSVNFTCDPCPVNCSSCALLNGSVSCLSCSSGLLDNGACVQSCKTLWYVPNGAICGPCDPNCKTCSGSPTFCLTCFNTTSPYFLKNKCYASCLDTYYNDNSNLLCIQCTIPCQTCYNYSSTACITCLSPYSLYGTNCKSTCPERYYANGALCDLCLSPCLTCSSPVLCFTCLNNYTLFASNYSCLSNCPDSYVSINLTCIPCSSNCFNCIAVTFCSNCHNNSFLLNGYCYNPCPAGYYSDAPSGSCKTCPISCSACTASKFCTGCASGYYMSNNSCISLCASNQVSISNVCKDCNSNCITCQGSINNCTACASDYLFAPTLNSCFQSCPVSLYYNPSAKTCIASCPSPSYIITNTSNNISTCIACNSLCTSCISDSQCGGCLSGTYSFNNFCHTSCPAQAQYPFSYKCQSCNVVGCLTCNGNACEMCSSGLFLIGSSLCITGCTSLQVYNSINKTCDTIITNTASSNSNASTSISVSANTNINISLNFIPMPFMLVYAIVTIVVILLHLKAKLSALPTLLAVIGPLLSIDIISIIIIRQLVSTSQAVIFSAAIYILAATLILTVSLSLIMIRIRYKLSNCQKSFILIFSILHHHFLALLAANINHYNSFFIKEHKSFWRKYTLACKIGMLLFVPILIAGVALVFSIQDRSNYIFYAGIELCILSFIQFLLTLAWIWLPVQPPPEKTPSVLSALSEQSTEQVSDSHEEVNEEQQDDGAEKGNSMDKLASKASKKEEPDEQVRIRNSDIKSEGQEMERKSNQSNNRAKSNYEFNQITGVVKVDATDIEKALERGFFRRNQEQILKEIKEEQEYSKIDDAQKLNNFLKKQEAVVNIFQDFGENEQEEDPISPKLKVLVNEPIIQPNKIEKNPSQTPISIPISQKPVSQGSMAMCDEPLQVKQQDFHYNIIFQENEQDNRTYFEGESQSNQPKQDYQPFQLQPTPSLGSIVHKDTNPIKINRPQQSPRLISPQFQSSHKESKVLVEDFQDSFQHDNFNIFNTGTSRIRPKFSKQLSKVDPPQKQIIHADFEQIITVEDEPSLEYIDDNEFAQHDSSRKIVSKPVRQSLHDRDHDNQLFRPSQILRQASIHYQPEIERNQAPKSAAEKPLPRFASQRSGRK